MPDESHLAVNSTWSSLTCDGKLLQNGGWSCAIERGLVNPPVRPLAKQNPAAERPQNTNLRMRPLSNSLSLSSCLKPFAPVTISGLSWASRPGPPPRWAWAQCPSAGGTRLGRSRRRWSADQPLSTPGWTSPRTCCNLPANRWLAQRPSCGGDPC